MSEALLEIKDLVVDYHTDEDDVHALNGVTLELWTRARRWGWWARPARARPPRRSRIMRLLPKRIGEVTSGGDPL